MPRRRSNHHAKWQLRKGGKFARREKPEMPRTKHHSQWQPRNEGGKFAGPTTPQPPTTRKRLRGESNLTPSSGSSSSLTPSSPDIPQEIPAVVEVPLSPPPPSMENRDSFTRSPAPSYAPGTRAVKGIAVPTGGDPPDLLQQILAAVKRGRPMQPRKATRVPVSGGEPANEVGASTSVAKDPEQKVTKPQRGLLGPSRLPNATPDQSTPKFGSSTPDELMLTTSSPMQPQGKRLQGESSTKYTTSEHEAITGHEETFRLLFTDRARTSSVRAGTSSVALSHESGLNSSLPLTHVHPVTGSGPSYCGGEPTSNNEPPLLPPAVATAVQYLSKGNGEKSSTGNELLIFTDLMCKVPHLADIFNLMPDNYELRRRHLIDVFKNKDQVPEDLK